MVNIRGDISRLKRGLVYTKFFDCFLDSILISLIVSGALLLFGISFMYSIIIGGGYLVFGFLKSAKKASLGEIEKKIPDLEWQLRTASDNSERTNEIIERLNLEVAEKIGFVGIYDLLSGKRTLKRVGGIFAIGMLIFYMQFSGFNLVSAVKSDGFDRGISGITGLFLDDESNTPGRKTGDIYGEESDINVGKRELEFELATEANELDLDKNGELGEGSSNGKKFTGVIGGKQDSSYSESINVDEMEIVENFYNNLNKQ
ncbi:MAG: hypothetical protein Q8Q42_00500 [Nanoarchaeota archaeon]|nr:hypothetical protein [Nanoarchaeota archaeon]